MNALPDIRTFDTVQLKSWLEKSGEKPFRAKQIFEWIWKHQVSSFDEMLNLSKALREKLAAEFSLIRIQIDSQKQSSDETIKYIFRLSDGNLVEGVLIPTASRVTACISSQAGCSLSC